jgi:hypothetical protein
MVFIANMHLSRRGTSQGSGRDSHVPASKEVSRVKRWFNNGNFEKQLVNEGDIWPTSIMTD